MFGIGSTELLVIFVVALLVLGPKSLVSLSKTLGKAMGEFRRVSNDFQRTLNAEVAQEEHEERKKQAEKEYFAKEEPAPAATAQAKPAPQPAATPQAAAQAPQQTTQNLSPDDQGTSKPAAPEVAAVPAPPAGSPLANAIAAAAQAAGTAKPAASTGEKA
jgi:sec-independent protein translocase protein TatB